MTIFGKASKKGFIQHQFFKPIVDMLVIFEKRKKKEKLKLFNKTDTGFTIIELVVVIAIIAVLSGIILFNVNQYYAKSRNTKRVADLSNIKKALEMYAADHNGQYPSTGGALVCLGVSSSEQCWSGPYGNDAVNSALLPYMSSIPIDPNSGRIYSTYVYRCPGSYWLPAGWVTGKYSVAFEPERLCPGSNNDCLGWTFGSWDESPPGPHCPSAGCCRQCGYLAQ